MFRDLVKTTTLVLFSRALSVLFMLLATMIAARQYGAELMGAIGVITSTALIGSIVFMFGMNISILKLIPKRRASHNETEIGALVFSVALMLFLIATSIGGLLALCALIVSHYAALGTSDLSTLFFVLTAPFLGFFVLRDYFLAVLRGMGKISAFAFFFPLSSLATLTFCISMAASGVTSNHFWMAFLIAPSVMLLPLSMHVVVVTKLSPNALSTRSKFFGLKKRATDALALISESWANWISAALLQIINNLDVLMVAVLLGGEEAGIYFSAQRIAFLLSFVLSAVNMSVAPRLADLYTSGKLSEFRALVKASTKLAAVSTALLAALIIGFGDFALGLFGSAFVDGVEILWILVGAHVINGFFGPVGYALLMSGGESVYVRIVLFGASIYVVTAVAGCVYFGAEGAAIGFLFASAIINFGSQVALRRRLGFSTLGF